MDNLDRTLDVFKKETMVTTTRHAQVMVVQDLARRNGIHHVPVVDDDRLIGVVCTCDLMHAPPDTPISSIMKPPVTLSPTASVESAARLMKERSVGSIVLVDADQPSGIVTRADIFGTDPEAARAAELPRCAHCGVTQHLRSVEAGEVLCIYCAGARFDTEVQR